MTQSVSMHVFFMKQDRQRRQEGKRILQGGWGEHEKRVMSHTNIISRALERPTKRGRRCVPDTKNVIKSSLAR